LTITAWRIVQRRHLAAAFTGDGARVNPGRWNELGTPVVYTTCSLSLAAMEMLVHLGSTELLGNYAAIPVTFDERLCRQLHLSLLPADWDSYPAPSSTHAIGASWIAEASSAVLAVPSAVVQVETVFLLNPRHCDFARIRIDDPKCFRFDARLTHNRQ
jgi:RES domain-containing protein